MQQGSRFWCYGAMLPWCVDSMKGVVTACENPLLLSILDKLVTRYRTDSVTALTEGKRRFSKCIFLLFLNF